MDSQRVSEFIRSYIKTESSLLDGMRQEAKEQGIPIVRDETGAFIQTVVFALKPGYILELGAASGYSSILMASADPGAERIDTIENRPDRAQAAKKNTEAAGFGDVINVIEGDAYEIMKGLEGSYDLVFIDAAKGQYPDYLKEAVRLTHEGSVIIADNVLQDGDILESRYAVKRRNRTIYTRLREFLDMITKDDMFTTSILPLGDGVTFSVRNR